MPNRHGWAVASALVLPTPSIRVGTRFERIAAGGVGAMQRHSILVVDDDPYFRDLYRTALRFEGFEVSTASDGLAALRSIEQERPSLVVLDVNMPCLDGWGVLRELAENEATRAIPVIVVTASDVEHATARAAAILAKPVAPEELLPVIRRQLPV
jgi:CheY-like chemotaxis protein